MNLILDALHDELTLALPDVKLWVRLSFRLLMAVFVAAIVGWEREREGKAAGLRTHVLVALGAAIFMLLSSESGASASELTRVTQGIAAGIGFIGGGVILKLEQDRTVKGLTTAASIWLTAALGAAAGAGRAPVAILGAILCWIVLVIFHHFEKKFKAVHEAAKAVPHDPD